MAYFFLSKSWDFWKMQRFWAYIVLKFHFQHLSKFLKNQVFDTRPPLPVWLVKILRFLRSAKILGLHRIEISGLATVKILGDIIRTMFFDAKAHGLLLRVKILGLLKSTKILGLHRIEILCLAPVEILRYFKRFFFLTPKPHGLYGLSKSRGF